MRRQSGIQCILCLAVVVSLVALVTTRGHAQNLMLVGYGPKFKDTDFASSFVRAIDWSSLTERIFFDAYLPVVLYPEEGEPVDNYSAPGEREDALNKLEDDKGLEIILLYIYVPEIAELAAEISVDLDTILTFRAIEVGSVLELREYLSKTREDPSGTNVLIVAYVP